MQLIFFMFLKGAAAHGHPQRNICVAFLLPLLMFSCAPESGYDRQQLNTLSVRAVYPEGEEYWVHEGVKVTIEETSGGASYTALTDAAGLASIRLANGNYTIRISDMVPDEDADKEYVFNGTQEKVMLTGSDREVRVDLTKTTIARGLVFREIYTSGCQKYPLEGTYQADKYVILHNNAKETRYLDGLCFATADPYNSGASNVWVSTKDGKTVYPDFVPVIQVIWQFPGSGTDHPLQPGEDAVVACCGAIDHTKIYEKSVNLNDASYYACYNPVLFVDTRYHPAPGDKIREDHILDVVIKMGVSKAFALSINSPAVLIFRAPEGTTIQDFLETAGNVIQKPGSSIDRIAKIPLEWVEDAVEVFTNSPSGNTKRLNPQLDAGYVRLSETFQGRVIYRRIDEEKTEARGYTVLQDTNNSASDCYDSGPDGQSLRKITEDDHSEQEK